MRYKTSLSALLTAVTIASTTQGQITINEGSSRNARTAADAVGEHHDWLELHNAGATPVDLAGYALSDDSLQPARWTFPQVTIPAHGHLLIHCSGEDRGPRGAMATVAQLTALTPTTGWNTHTLTSPIHWDGTSNLLIQTCGLRGALGGPLNAVFYQTTTPFLSSAGAFGHDPSLTCAMPYGDLSHRRPVMRVNGHTIGLYDWLNAFVQLPAPYANWQGGAKQAYLILASELLTAGVSPGPITTLGFNVVNTHGAQMEQLDIHMELTTQPELTAAFRPTQPSDELHTNFKLGRNGETIYLYSPAQVILDSLHVVQGAPDHSNGRSQDGGDDDVLFTTPTPGASNNASTAYNGYANTPIIDPPSTLSATPVNVVVYNTNTAPSEVRYTLDGSEPTAASTLYTGPITLANTAVLKACAFKPGNAPSPVAAASYLIGADHTTAVISVVTPEDGLHGAQGIFTNWHRDDEVQAHVDHFRPNGQLVVSQFAGMQVDGGLGGSRGFPQHSFRLEFDNGTLGDGRVNTPLIPDRPARTRYSRIYLRNGSNQFQILPHKDAAQVKMMAGATKSYYSAWTPATVYINGQYFGLYELREKFDDEYFRTLENADADSVDLLSVSAWNGAVLRPTEGQVDPFWQDLSAFLLIDPGQPDFWDLANERFDLEWYTDYIIGQQWMGTKDWPVNNIKIQRSNATAFKWRFCTIDLELAMAPNGQSDHTFNAITWTANQPNDVPYTRIWQRGVENPRFHDHFINRFADVMNSAYLNDRIVSIAEQAYILTRPEMGRQFQRWSSSDTTALLAQFDANHAAFVDDLEQRTPVMRDHIQNHFALPRQVDITLDVVPAGAGSIRISTLHPDTYPWEGVYFDGVPVRIEAVAEEGYAFSHWTPNAVIDQITNTTFLDTLAAYALLFEANFIQDFPTALNNTTRPLLAVAPNPATTELTVNTEALQAPLRYEILDLRGQRVRQGVLGASPRAVLPLGTIANGHYQLHVTDQHGTRAVARFVKL